MGLSGRIGALGRATNTHRRPSTSASSSRPIRRFYPGFAQLSLTRWASWSLKFQLLLRQLQRVSATGGDAGRRIGLVLVAAAAFLFVLGLLQYLQVTALLADHGDPLDAIRWPTVIAAVTSLLAVVAPSVSISPHLSRHRSELTAQLARHQLGPRGQKQHPAAGSGQMSTVWVPKSCPRHWSSGRPRIWHRRRRTGAWLPETHPTRRTGVTP